MWRGPRLRVREDERLARDFDLVTIEASLRRRRAVKPVLVVTTRLSEVAAALIGAPSLSLRKGAFARLDADRPLVAGSGSLRWLVSPDLLGGKHAR